METVLPAACCNLTSPVQGQEMTWDVKRGSMTAEAGWGGKPQQAPPPLRDRSPPQQSLSGETRRGRPPVPDPTGTEDTPLSQVPLPYRKQCLAHLSCPAVHTFARTLGRAAWFQIIKTCYFLAWHLCLPSTIVDTLL